MLQKLSYEDVKTLIESKGARLLRESNPNYKYFKPKERVLESRNKYQKHKLKNVLDNFDSSLSEYQNMLNNGYLRIWDCGNKVYIYENNK